MDKKKKKLDRPVLAEGEATGHAHVLQDPSVEVYENTDLTREFNLTKKTKLNHEEHNTVELEPGKYVCDIVRETDPFEGERRVMD